MANTTNFKILLDVPLGRTDSDSLALNHGDLARAFREVIEHSDPQFAIGIFGGWGAGKTTLMQAIESRLDPMTCVTVWFSAWRYEKEEHLIVPLLDVIREGLVHWQKTRATDQQSAALKAASSIGVAIDALLRGFSFKAKIPGIADIGFDPGKVIDQIKDSARTREEAEKPRSFYHASFRAMQDAFDEFTQNGARRIVVFVDDLDRCLPEGALEVLESMKLFFDLKGFIFVVGVDRRVVEMSVEKRYREMVPPPKEGAAPVEAITGAQYLRKIFQVPYGLAPVSTAQIDNFLWSVRAHADLPQEQADEIEYKVRPHLTFLTDERGVNPREIKRYVNSYTLVRKISPWLEEGVVLTLQTIAFRQDWSEVQLALLAFRDVFMDALVREVDEPGVGHLGTVWPSLETPPASFLSYIGPTGPGRALYDHAARNATIDDFIFSGEATRSSEGSNFIYVFRALGEAVLHIRGALENNKDTKEILNQVSQAQGQLMSFSEGQGGPYEAVRRDLERLMQDIERSDWDREDLRDSDMAELREGLAKAWTDRLRAVIANLQESYRAGLT